VTYSYGLAADDEVIIMKVHDASDRSTIYFAYAYPENDDGSWEPWNGTPKLGEELGECEVVSTEEAEL
jgi:hypothetical protein